MRPISLLLAAAAVLVPGAASAGAMDLLYERTVMSAADDRCGLFAPEVAAALDAGRLQARGAALRGGAPDAAVASVEQRARARAAGAPCDGRDLQLASSRVRGAFEGWRGIGRMNFPGERQGWTADRVASREPRWRLRQDARLGFERATLGVGGTHLASALVASVEGARPSSARLVMRNPARSARPITSGPLSSRLPSGTAARAFLPEHRAPAVEGLRSGVAPATAFRFPAAALRALEALDAREAVAVEFIDARGGVRRAVFEVGDFAAAQAFLAAARR